MPRYPGEPFWFRFARHLDETPGACIFYAVVWCAALMGLIIWLFDLTCP
jgi:hypothetical protein